MVAVKDEKEKEHPGTRVPNIKTQDVPGKINYFNRLQLPGMLKYYQRITIKTDYHVVPIITFDIPFFPTFSNSSSL